LGKNGVIHGAISYGFFLHELLSITPDSPVFLFNKGKEKKKREERKLEENFE
jgi:hypothetical protein